MTDVVVVGAGLSGLVATWKLRERGLTVRTFDARSRLGGRLHRPAAEAVDLGASWVWDDEPHIHALLEALGLQTFDHHRTGTDLYDDGTRLLRGRLPRSHVPERRVVGGTTAIIDALGERAGPVEQGTPVTRISRRPGGLVVHTPNEQVHARTVLAALPPALLAATVELPELSAKELSVLASCPTWMEDVAKVVVRYPERFWADAGLSGRAASRVGPLAELHDLSGPDGSAPAIFGFLPRPAYSEDWRDRVLDQLAHLFGPRARQPSATYATAWWTEPHTSLPRSRPAVDRLLGHPVLRTPLLDGCLRLVSTETASSRPGHMDGAVERALSVVAELADASVQMPAGAQPEER